MVANIAKATFDIRLGNDLSQSQFESFCKEYFSYREKEIRDTGNDYLLYYKKILKKNTNNLETSILEHHLDIVIYNSLKNILAETAFK